MSQLVFATAQISFFLRHHYLQLESAIPPESCALLASALIRLPREKKPLWVTDPSLFKWIRTHKLSRTLSELIGVPGLRILDARRELLVDGPTPVRNLFPYQGSKLLLQLELQDNETIGSLTLYDPDYVLLESIQPKKGHTPLLLLLGDLQTRYIDTPADPYGDWAKLLGYGYGDLLSDETHPKV